MSTSSIEWTEVTWNPTTGCDQISAGCDNCYALTLAKRLKAMGSAKYQTDGDPATSGPGFGLAMHRSSLDEPLRWRRPRTVFVNSMSDLFHDKVPPQFIGSVWNTMACTPQHTYQILTKRPARARTILNGWARDGWYWRCHDMGWAGPVDGPLRNVWLGTSIESEMHIKRAHHLRETPAAVRFVSAEPLLGPLHRLDLISIDWLIVGGESGPNARPVEAEWIRDLRDRCAESGTAFFFKQAGVMLAREWDCTDINGRNPGDWPEIFPRQYPAGMQLATGGDNSAGQ